MSKTNTVGSTAVISPCGLYRYRLDRIVAPQGPVYAFFGINPSTADATMDDATVRKWIGFTKAWGGSRFIVGNVFAYRATDVRDIANDPAPLGSIANRDYIKAICNEADVLVPCWGSREKVPTEHRPHIDSILARLRASGKPLRCFGLTKSGDPKHPLMLGYSTVLRELPMSAPIRVYPEGTLLFSAIHGQRVLRRASAMEPGTMCLVAYRDVGSRSIWLPCDELRAA